MLFVIIMLVMVTPPTRWRGLKCHPIMALSHPFSTPSTRWRGLKLHGACYRIRSDHDAIHAVAGIEILVARTQYRASGTPPIRWRGLKLIVPILYREGDATHAVAGIEMAKSGMYMNIYQDATRAGPRPAGRCSALRPAGWLVY